MIVPVTSRWLATILLSVLLTATLSKCCFAGNANLDRHFYQGELLKIDGCVLYIWVNAAIEANSDFLIEIELPNDETFTTPVESAIGKLAVSAPITDTLCSLLSQLDNPAISLYLDQSDISFEPLRLGMAAILSNALQTTTLIDSAVRDDFVIREFQSLSDAEIELAIGEIDLLLLPEEEIREYMQCRFTTIMTDIATEWYFLLDLPDYDLYSAALCYALKGELGGLESLLIIDPLTAQTVFPRYQPNAKSLFAQIPVASRLRLCHFALPEMFPRIISQFQKEVARNGGGLIVSDADTANEINLGFVLVESNDSVATAKALQQLYEQVDAVQLSWRDQICQFGDGDYLFSQDEYKRMSKLLSENLWLVPLGKSKMVLVMRSDVHHVSDPARAVRISDFYRVTSQ